MFRADIADFTPLETPRLIIRPLMLPDARDLYAVCCNDAVSRFVLWSTHRSIADTKAFIRSVMRQYRMGEPASWGIQLKNGPVIGTIGFVGINHEHSLAEVGYSLGQPHWGNGYATEALSAVLAFGLERMHLNRIEAQYDVNNPASRRVMEKAGMRFEGVHRQKLYNKGAYVDVGECAILARDYRAAKSEKLLSTMKV